MQNFVVHSNEMACRKMSRLGLDQLFRLFFLEVVFLELRWLLLLLFLHNYCYFYYYRHTDAFYSSISLSWYPDWQTSPPIEHYFLGAMFMLSDVRVHLVGENCTWHLFTLMAFQQVNLNNLIVFKPLLFISRHAAVSWYVVGNLAVIFLVHWFTVARPC